VGVTRNSTSLPKRPVSITLFKSLAIASIS
jgi:hypothetical protein